MALTFAFIIFVAWSSFVLTAASHHGRILHRVHRWARGIFIFGVALAVPVIVVGSYGLPASFSYRWFGILANVGCAGLALAVAGAFAWLVADSVFVWKRRRQVLPFAFRGPSGGEG